MLYLLYRSVDLRGVLRVLEQADPARLAVAIGMIAPITVLRAYRFMWLMPRGAVAGIAEATRITVVASAFNLFLPAKAGDFAKSLIVARQGGAAAGVSAAVVVYERLSDMFGTVVWCLVGAMAVRPVAPLLPDATWTALGAIGTLCGVLILSERLAVLLRHVVHEMITARRLQVLRVLADGWPALMVNLRGSRVWLGLFSIGLWFVQLAQIWLFTVAVSAQIPLAVCASLSAIALIVAQLPISIGGIGIRDVALVLLLSPYMSPEKAAAVGILTASRGLFPPLAALPVLRRYLNFVVPRTEP